MADAELRALEQRFRATGSLEDEVAWLGAKLRAGLLARDRLELAAWLGQPAARRVAGPGARDFHAPPRSAPEDGPLAGVELPTGWIATAAPLDPEVGIRAGIAALNLVLPAARPPWAGERSPVELAEDWLACPCERHAALAQAVADGMHAHLHGPSGHLGQAVAFLLGLAADGLLGAPPMALGDSPDGRLLAGILGDTPPATWAAMDVLARAMVAGAGLGISVEAISAAVRAELAPWLLGAADPVRMRVAERGEIEILPEDLLP